MGEDSRLCVDCKSRASQRKVLEQEGEVQFEDRGPIRASGEDAKERRQFCCSDFQTVHW